MASMGRPGAPDLLEKIPASYTVAPAPSALIPKALRFVGDSATRSATCKSMVASAATPLLQRWACLRTGRPMGRRRPTDFGDQACFLTWLNYIALLSSRTTPLFPTSALQLPTALML